MFKRKIAFALFTVLCITDKTALSVGMERGHKSKHEYRQDWRSIGSRIVGITGGMLTGAAIGVLAGGMSGICIAMYKNPQGDTVYNEKTKQDEPKGRSMMFTGAYLGGIIGGSLGAVGGYRKGGSLGIWLLQKRYNASLSVVKTSIAFGLLLSEHRDLLVAADEQKSQELKTLLTQSMKDIFGDSWKQQMMQLLEYESLPLVLENASVQGLGKANKFEAAHRIFNAVYTLHFKVPLKTTYSFEESMNMMKIGLKTFLN